jgi:hypothetical protein
VSRRGRRPDTVLSTRPADNSTSARARNHRRLKRVNLQEAGKISVAFSEPQILTTPITSLRNRNCVSGGIRDDKDSEFVRLF